jgi:hypothetical protein
MPAIARAKSQGRTTDELCELIMSGKFLSEIARDWGMSQHAIMNWVASDEERAARVREARNISGEAWDREAHRVLAEIPDEAAPGQIARARELASHLRWRASKISTTYRDRQELTGKDGAPLVVVPESQLLREIVSMAAEAGLPVTIEGEGEAVDV